MAAGSPRVVFASTVVTGDAGGRLLTEDEPLPVADARTGARSRTASACSPRAACRLSCIRPSHVYGPGGWYAEDLVARLRQPGRFA